jgi:formamidopyrimidine-DNA glycosylase
MPELPEVETIRRDLLLNILNKKIINITINDAKVVLGKKDVWKKNLVNNSFVDILRIGKLLAFKLSNNKYVLLHLRMTGQLIYQAQDKLIAGGHSFSTKTTKKARGGELPNKFTRLIIEFLDHSQLYFNDIRRFAYTKIVSEQQWLDERKRFGLEPGSSNFNFNDFFRAISERRSVIKAVLLNQAIISGLGNIYVDESLFLSRIHPQRLANTLSKKELKLLFVTIEKLIQRALKYRGTTFSDYVDAKGVKGNFSNRLKVYGREGEKCLVCEGKIDKIRVAGRGTHFCANCQK